MTETKVEVALIGAGTIGASWAALFIANGLKTVVYDLNDSSEAPLRTNVETALQRLRQIERYRDSLSIESALSLLSFATSLESAVCIADIIQENAPEKLDLKLDLYNAIDKSMKPNALLCSSTSGLRPSDLQAGLPQHAANFVVGHPFNPPHLIPLVEVVGGALTSATTIQQAMDFYTSLGKRPVHVRKEVPGHVANRLQAALFREIFHLLEDEVATVADLETAMEYGPGLRWGIMGPSLLLHLGGGPGGAEEYANKFLSHLMTWYSDRDPAMTEALVQRWVQETTAVSAKSTRAQLERRRDDDLIGVLNRKERPEDTIPGAGGDAPSSCCLL
ncbi:hypothetical protein N7540_005999 [Penicillium herquei]|nr:hypothetical protein N7540_005999 [Penicillium herquei]